MSRVVLSCSTAGWFFQSREGSAIGAVFDTGPTGRALAILSGPPLPSSKYVAAPTREMRRYCFQVVEPAVNLVSSVSVVAAGADVSDEEESDSERTRPSIGVGCDIPSRARTVGAISILPVGSSST